MKAVVRKIVAKYVPVDGMTEKETGIVRIMILILVILMIMVIIAGLIHG